MRHKTPALLTLLLSVIMAATALTVGLRTWGSPADGAETAEQDNGETRDGSPGLDQPEEAASAVTPEPTVAPWTGPLVPDQGARISKEYFADAAFIGNSVMSGLELYDYDMVFHDEDWNTIPDFYWANSLTVLDVSSQVSQMEGCQYGKVYVCLGTNEMSYDKDVLRQEFTDLIHRLQENNPGCILYLMSVPPVSAYKSSTDGSYTREHVREMNDMLQDIAREEQIWYLDVYSVLCDSDGYLPSSVTNDGVHFSGDHYSYWFDYLQTHYVPDGTPVQTEAPAEEVPAE